MALQGKFTWRITNFSRRESERKIYSDVFTVGGYKWWILVFPKGNNVDHFSMYLGVADSGGLPSGWSIDTKFSLTLVNQIQRNDSTMKEVQHKFTVRENDWGFTSFKRLTELRDRSKGHLVNDTLAVEAEVVVFNNDVVHPPPVVFQEPPPVVSQEPPPPPVVAETNMFDTFFSNLEKFIIDSEGNSAFKAGPSLNSKVPSLEEVEMAKQSLKECLSDLFKLNMKDRLATALKTLTRAKVGLSFEQHHAIQSFMVEFDDFVSDFLTFEQDNSEFELQKLARDQMFCSIKKNHKTHLSNKQLLDDLTKEEEELNKRMEKVKSIKAKLISDWATLMTESEETKSKYTAQEKKLAEAEEKKRIAEERMSRSTAAWSSLKTHFV